MEKGAAGSGFRDWLGYQDQTDERALDGGYSPLKLTKFG